MLAKAEILETERRVVCGGGGDRGREGGVDIQWLKSEKGVRIGACVFHQNQENRLSVKKSQSFYKTKQKSIAPCKRQNKNGNNDKKKDNLKQTFR